ncbi:MAG: GNAT family N-acetyltransferase [Candidatus Thorarchaeota archaeon]|nr:MAG: GNAT family N-acetyltransferase [Candidatus Thorarchaeota archaeon]
MVEMKEDVEFKMGEEVDEEFLEYYSTTMPWRFGPTEEKHIRSDPNHLITWRLSGRIIGHAIWHESSATEHTPGDKRTEQAISIHEQLMDRDTEFIELHELWLGVDYRGRGYGSAFIDFFEDFMRELGHNEIVHYTDNPSAIALFRIRGYKEAYGVVDGDNIWNVFYLSLDVDAQSGE